MAPRVATGLVVGTSVVLVARGGVEAEPVTFVVAAVVAGTVGATMVALRRLGGAPVVERRGARPALPCACSERRRTLLVGAGAAAAVTATGGLGWLLRASGRAERMLARTPWRPGVALVDERGRRVATSSLSPGTVTTVWPEDHPDDETAQAIVIHLRPGQVISEPGRDDWTAGGFVAYSKLCTHMGCPVGLYQEEANVLVCPCHQAVFDVLRGARPILGPANRPLPQLPLAVDEEGVLIAGGDFSTPVGSGFWGRPVR